MELMLLLLVPSFSTAAYDVTATFLLTGGGMLADALFPVREACFLAVAGAGPVLLLLEGPPLAVAAVALFVEGRAER